MKHSSLPKDIIHFFQNFFIGLPLRPLLPPDSLNIPIF
jgi:hypothetical protein